MDCALESFRATVACCADSGLPAACVSEAALGFASARSTSSLTIRPPGPVPVTCSALRPARSSLRRNAGEILTAVPEDATEVSGSAATSGSSAVLTTAAPCAATKASTAASVTDSGAMTPISCPTGNSAPISAKIRTSVPEVRASKLLTILSVSISTMSSPAATVSPTFLCQATIVPCVISIPHFGIVTASSPSLIILPFCQRSGRRYGKDH